MISKSELILLGGIFDYDLKAEQLVEVERELEQPDVWNDPERAQELGKQRSDLELVVNTISTFWPLPGLRKVSVALVFWAPFRC